MFKQLTTKIKFLGVLLLMILSSLFAGCGAASGSFCSLTELYENGIITREDIMNVAALRTGKVEIVIDNTKERWEWEHEEIVFDPVMPDSPLSKATQRKIEYGFKATKKGNKFESFEIVKYYGTYSGFVIVEIKYKFTGLSEVDSVAELILADVYLGYINTKTVLVAWRENVR